MKSMDYFKIVYIILSELFCAMQAGERFNPESIKAERLKISDGYLADIIINLIDDGYIRGVKVIKLKTGVMLSGVEEMKITSEGVQYLEENSMMNKVKEAMMDLKQMVPLI